MSQANYSTQGEVAVLTLENPPVNGLAYEVRRGIAEGLDRAWADSSIKAVVIIGGGNAFSGGADIREFNTPKASAEPTLRTVLREIEDGPKPVIAAVHGVAMGGGLELALACHYRVALPGAQIALPEVKLGILPGAGGTQRLPRVVGVETALNMIVSGAAVPSEQLRGTALFDRFVEGDLLKGAVAFAREVADQRPLRRVRDIPIRYPQAEGFFAFARRSVAAASKGYPAPLKCVAAVEAAVSQPFEEGLRIERELFESLVITTESKALRHAFFAERAASKIPDVPEGTPIRPIRTAAVVGAGTMGGGIAMNFANA
ncbi:MAG TPA: enoyl-CoA hydratase-related protein, partial [Myxococcaceae bacterium]|nr:enoyl-CoA hydratase-related protein [Myxococcaceae bacterium]